jgi:hypothetical protein
MYRVINLSLQRLCQGLLSRSSTVFAIQTNETFSFATIEFFSKQEISLDLPQHAQSLRRRGRSCDLSVPVLKMHGQIYRQGFDGVLHPSSSKTKQGVLLSPFFEPSN